MSTAGWIFADMLLVLMIVGLGTQMTLAAQPEPEPEAVPVKQKTAVPTMSKKAVKRTVTLDVDALLSGSDAERKKELVTVRKDIKKATRSLGDKRAAMVLVWGQSPEVGRGTRIAKIVGGQLPRTNKSVFADVVPRPLWTGGKEGVVELEMYVFSH